MSFLFKVAISAMLVGLAVSLPGKAEAAKDDKCNQKFMDQLPTICVPSGKKGF